jgi:hypothetical protein
MSILFVFDDNIIPHKCLHIFTDSHLVYSYILLFIIVI